MRTQRGPVVALRNTIAAMPHRSKVAMLRGLDENRIIAGAYVDGRGGVCPMLAAHRGGGRTSLGSFAKAWDRYTDASRARRVNQRELRTLRTLLEESLIDDVDVDEEDVRRAVADHRRLVAQRSARDRPLGAGKAETPMRRDTRARPDTGERDRTSELSHRHGWAWTRLFRRYDQYEATLERLEQLPRERGSAAEPDAGATRERPRVPAATSR
jgi:hypothetical protein